MSRVDAWRASAAVAGRRARRRRRRLATLVRARRSARRERGDQEAEVVRPGCGRRWPRRAPGGCGGGREERALGRDVGGRGDARRGRRGVDDPGCGESDGDRERREGDRDRRRGRSSGPAAAAASAYRRAGRRTARPAPRAAAGPGPRSRPRRAALVEGVDREGDREGPGRDRHPGPAVDQPRQVAIAEHGERRPQGGPQTAPWRVILLDRRRSRRRRRGLRTRRPGSGRSAPRAGRVRRGRSPGSSTTNAVLARHRVVLPARGAAGVAAQADQRQPDQLRVAALDAASPPERSTRPNGWWNQIVRSGLIRRISRRAARDSGSESGRGPEYSSAAERAASRRGSCG